MASALRALVFSLLVALSPLAIPSSFAATPSANGVFQGSDDIGHAQPGGSTFDPAHGSYEVRGGGEDVWGTADDFRFTWTRVEGDASLGAEVHINAPVTYRLAKGMLMFRQSLDPGSPYADVAIHADGHITLQYRLTQGGETKDVTLPEHNAMNLRIVRHGNIFTVFAGAGGAERKNGPSISLPMQGLVYLGVGVCSHSTDALQSVTFSHVSLLSH